MAPFFKAGWGAAIRRGWLALTLVPTVAAAQVRVPPHSPPDSDMARLVVTRPTVVAFLVVPAGAVDTSPELAVVADDWNYAMAALGDRLEARGIDYVLVTESTLRVSSRGATAVTLSLGEPPATGYVFALPGAVPCMRRGPAEPDSVLRAADAFFTRSPTREARPRDACGPAIRGR